MLACGLCPFDGYGADFFKAVCAFLGITQKHLNNVHARRDFIAL
jgi:hypothetical protein